MNDLKHIIVGSALSLAFFATDLNAADMSEKLIKTEQQRSDILRQATGYADSIRTNWEKFKSEYEKSIKQEAEEEAKAELVRQKDPVISKLDHLRRILDIEDPTNDKFKRERANLVSAYATLNRLEPTVPLWSKILHEIDKYADQATQKLYIDLATQNYNKL